jgi:hypothetical protein
MMKRIGFLLLILFIGLLPHVTPLVAQENMETWVDGLYLVIDPPGTPFSNTATIIGHLERRGDRADPQTVYATVEIALHCETRQQGQIVQTVDIPLQSVEIPLDYDWLAVSNDLGWAGLDTVVSVYDRISNSYVPLEVHVSLFATFRAYENADRFQRNSLFPTASLSTPGCSLHSVSAPSGNRAYIFSESQPHWDASS